MVVLDIIHLHITFFAALSLMLTYRHSSFLASQMALICVLCLYNWLVVPGDLYLRLGSPWTLKGKVCPVYILEQIFPKYDSTHLYRQ